MTTLVYATVVVILWVLAGLAAVVVLLARQGYRDRLWYLLGAVLGPLFIPIAAERARRDVVVLERTGRRAADARPPGITAVVGVDGSAESRQAVRDAGRLFGGNDTRVVLLTVVDPDVGESGDPRWQAADDLLIDCQDLLPDSSQPVLHIGRGQPARVLLDVARTEGADVLVLGRRGKGLDPDPGQRRRAGDQACRTPGGAGGTGRGRGARPADGAALDSRRQRPAAD